MIELDFSNKSKPTATTPRNDPCDVFRNALEQQIEAVDAQLNGETYCIQRRRYHGGKSSYIDVPLRVWWWNDGKSHFITLRYSSQIVRLKQYESIRCKSLEDVRNVLLQIRAALDVGDEDVLEAVLDAFERTRWKKVSAVK